MQSRVKINYIFICWLIAVFAMMGSLFFSEVMGYPPCVLCWYQRVAMYPLVALFFVGAIKQENSVFDYTLPISIIGWIISIYHNLLHYEIIPEEASPCIEGVSCSTVYINWFNFVTIPVLSFLAFSLLIGLSVKGKKKL